MHNDDYQSGAQTYRRTGIQQKQPAAAITTCGGKRLVCDSGEKTPDTRHMKEKDSVRCGLAETVQPNCKVDVLAYEDDVGRNLRGAQKYRCNEEPLDPRKPTIEVEAFREIDSEKQQGRTENVRCEQLICNSDRLKKILVSQPGPDKPAVDLGDRHHHYEKNPSPNVRNSDCCNPRAQEEAKERHHVVHNLL